MSDLPDPGTAAHQCGELRTTTQKPWHSRGYLPHFDQPGLVQHITYRLADSLPAEALAEITKECIALGNDAVSQAELRCRIELYLDAGHGSCCLREPGIANCIIETWRRFDSERYRLLAWVVMPNHCHVLIETLPGWSLGKIVWSWKSYTARVINASRRTGVRRSQEKTAQIHRVWQREYWDRFIRDEAHFHTVRQYIEQNPVAAHLASHASDWKWSSANPTGSLSPPTNETNT